MLTTPENRNWVENFTTKLLRRVKQSRWAESIIDEAEFLRDERGFAIDVAIAMVARDYYEMNISDIDGRPAFSRKAEIEIRYLGGLIAKHTTAKAA